MSDGFTRSSTTEGTAEINRRWRNWRQGLAHTIEQPAFRFVVISVISLNSLIMMLERDPMPPQQKLFLENANFVFTGVYAVEMALKIFAKGIRRYLADPFDRYRLIH